MLLILIFALSQIMIAYVWSLAVTLQIKRVIPSLQTLLTPF